MSCPSISSPIGINGGARPVIPDNYHNSKFQITGSQPLLVSWLAWSRHTRTHASFWSVKNSRSDSAATTGIVLQYPKVTGIESNKSSAEEGTEPPLLLVSPELDLGGDLKVQDLLSTIDCCVW